MKKVIHIEDNLDWQMKVADALKPLDGLKLIQFVSSEEIMKGVCAGDSVGDLYILDRHIYEKPTDYGPNDDSWRKIARVIASLTPREKRIIMLSNHVPRDVFRYEGVLAGIPKQTFNPDSFREQIKHYLNLA